MDKLGNGVWKKAAALFICAAFLTALSGCGGSKSAGSAEENVEGLMQAAQAGDFDKMESYVADESWDEALKETLTVDAWNNFVQEQAPKITYEITDVSESGSEATVTVEVSYLDCATAYATAFNACFSEISTRMTEDDADVTEEEIYEILDEKLQAEADSLDEDACRTDVTLTLTCSKDNDWKVTSPGDDFLAVVSANLTGYAGSMNTVETTDSTESAESSESAEPAEETETSESAEPAEGTETLDSEKSAEDE